MDFLRREPQVPPHTLYCRTLLTRFCGSWSNQEGCEGQSSASFSVHATPSCPYPFDKYICTLLITRTCLTHLPCNDLSCVRRLVSRLYAASAVLPDALMHPFMACKPILARLSASYSAVPTITTTTAPASSPGQSRGYNNTLLACDNKKAPNKASLTDKTTTPVIIVSIDTRVRW